MRCMSTHEKTPKQYGKLPAKRAEAIPWDALCVDLVGQWTITIDRKKGTTRELKAITFIDPATGWFELDSMDDKDSASMACKRRVTST